MTVLAIGVYHQPELFWKAGLTSLTKEAIGLLKLLCEIFRAVRRWCLLSVASAGYQPAHK
jgi:hypothetical protein